MSGQRFVTEYTETQCYGGPEEGGWYYWVLEVNHCQKFSSNKTARRVLDKKNKEYRDYNRNNYDDKRYFTIENKKELGKRDNSNEPRPHYE